MRRIVWIIVLVTCAVFGLMFYQYQAQQKELTQLHEYQNVLYDKAEQIYVQAQDWSTPIQVDPSDPRLSGDYALMAEFVISHLVQSAEARNSYLRELKALQWDQFLDIKRLNEDKKQDYAETEAMLSQVKAMMELYQEHLTEHEAQALAQIEELPIKSHLRRQLSESLLESRQNDEGTVLFELEKQSLSQAYVLLGILKNNRWEMKNNLFMFYEDTGLKQFNQAYQDMLKLNQQMQEITQAHQQALAEKL